MYQGIIEEAMQSSSRIGPGRHIDGVQGIWPLAIQHGGFQKPRPHNHGYRQILYVGSVQPEGFWEELGAGFQYPHTVGVEFVDE